MAEDKEEISAQDLFERLIWLTRYVLSKWIFLLFAGVICASINLFLAINSKPVYNGSLTFVLSTESRSGAYSSLANQLGFDIAGDARNNVFSGDNILVLFKSEKMIKSVLLKTPPDSTQTLANIIIRETGLDMKWNKKNRTKNQFPFPADTSRYTLIQDSLLREVYYQMATNYITVSRMKNLSVFQLNTISTSEVIACYVTKYLMNETAKFYINTKTSSAKKAVALLQKEADSLRGLLSGSIVSTASEGDRTFALNPAMQVQRSSIQQGQVKISVISAAYAQIVQSLESAKINLQNENPLYEIIDSPQLPLVAVKKSKTKAVIYGFAIGVSLVCAFLFLIKFIRYITSIKKNNNRNLLTT